MRMISACTVSGGCSASAWPGRGTERLRDRSSGAPARARLKDRIIASWRAGRRRRESGGGGSDEFSLGK